MSYCRWSSDDFQCDLYCYADVNGGYTTHVAANKVIYAEPLPPYVPASDTQAFIERHQQVMAMVERATRVPIEGPHDGESFNDPTPRDAAKRLEALRALGYRVPQYAIDTLNHEEDE